MAKAPASWRATASVEEANGGGGRLALHFVAAELVDRLRREAEVPHDGDAEGDERADGFDDGRAAFELDGLAPASCKKRPAFRIASEMPVW